MSADPSNAGRIAQMLDEKMRAFAREAEKRWLVVLSEIPEQRGGDEMNEISIKHLGCKGHFICRARVQWARHTIVGDEFIVSTLGWLRPLHEIPDEPVWEPMGIGQDELFETMVFRSDGERVFPQQHLADRGCGCHQLGEEVSLVHYATPGEANDGHDAAIARCVEMVREEEKR